MNNMSDTQLLTAVGKKLYNQIFQIMTSDLLLDDELKENPSELTTHEVTDKIRAFMAQNPRNDVFHILFLRYLSFYPVSMCSRDVSPLLRCLIGLHYRLGAPDKEQEQSGAEKTSYEDLSQIFVRSKATVSDCVNRTENLWRNLQQERNKDQAIETEAQRQLIEERKELLKNQESKELMPLPPPPM